MADQNHEVHVVTEVIQSNPEEHKFELPGSAPLLEVLCVGAQRASVQLLPNNEQPLDRLHVMFNHHEVGPAIEDLQQTLRHFLKHDQEKNHFGIELVRAFRVNTRWAVAPQPEMTPHQILDLLGINYQEYTLYKERSATPLPLDTPLIIERGMIFEAQRDGKYGGGTKDVP